MSDLLLTSLPGAKASFFVTGTSTPLAVYTDPGLTTPATNPVIADANGLFPDIWLQARIYKMVLTDSSDNTILTEDPVYKARIYAIESAAPAITFPGLEYDNTTDGNRYERNQANSAWVNKGPSSGAGNIASISEILAATDNAKTVTPLGLAAHWAKGADVTLTDTTLSLPSTGGGFFAVSGAFNIAAINSATDGREIWVNHTVARTLTHSSNFTTLTGVDLAVRAGDLTRHVREGSAWKMVAHVSTRDNTVGARTGSYTATANENGKAQIFTVSTAATLSLPAASGLPNGFRMSVSNAPASTATVTIDPSGSETIDGIASRILHPGDRVTIVCNGANWFTESGTPYRFVSTDQTITPGAILTIAHGLARRPRDVVAELVCTGAELSFLVGDVLEIPLGPSSTGLDIEFGFSVKKDATNIIALLLNDTAVFRAVSGGELEPLTNSNWRLRLTATE